MSAKKLAFFTNSMAGGGAQRVLLNIANYCAEKGHSVDLILGYKEGPYLTDVHPSIRIIELSSKQGLSKLGWVWQLKRYLDAEQPHRLLSTLRYPNGVAIMAGKLSKAPTKVIIREACVIGEELKYCTWPDRFLRWLKVRATYHHANQIVVMSEAMIADLCSLTPVKADQCTIIANPTVTPALLEMATEPVTHPWFAAGLPPVILAAGRLEHQKAFEILIQAFAKLRQHNDCRLLIFGEGPDRAKLERLIQKLGLQTEISLPGFEPNPFAYMRKAACFAMPSRFEGMPNVLIQAMACGCPVVATDCSSGVREIINEPALGHIVPIDDIEALTNALAETLKNPTPPEALKARANDFHIDVIMPHYSALLDID